MKDRDDARHFEIVVQAIQVGGFLEGDVIVTRQIAKVKGNPDAKTLTLIVKRAAKVANADIVRLMK